VFKEAGVVLKSDGHVGTKTRYFIEMNFLIPHHLFNELVLWKSLRFLAQSCLFFKILAIVTEEVKSYALILQEDFLNKELTVACGILKFDLLFGP